MNWSRFQLFWKRRTLLEKWSLFLLSVLLIIIIVILAITSLRENSPHAAHDTCLTPACVKSAAQVLQKADLNIDPCDDFYKFSCGSFTKNTFIPDYKTSISSFTIVNDMVETQIRTLLEKPIKSTDKKPFFLAKSLYRACMNTRSIEENSVPTLKNFITSVGGWPVLEGEKWNETDFNWINTTQKFINLGFFVNHFINFGIQINSRLITKRMLYLDQPLNIGYDEVLRRGPNDSMLRAYKNVIVKFALALGAENQRALMEMKEVVDLDILINKIKIPIEQRSKATAEYNRMTIKDLETKFPNIPWLDFINAMLDPVKTLSERDIIVVTVPKYYERLARLLKSTPKRVLANYMFKNLVRGLVPFLNEKMRDINFEYVKITAGISEKPPRWIECTGMAKRLYAAVGALYVNNFFKKESKDSMIEMVENIKRQLLETITNLDWMDDITRDHALDKAKAMVNQIAYPHELLDDKKLEDFYKNLTLDSTKYLESVQNFSKFSHFYKFSQLVIPVEENKWLQYSTVTSINAFYRRNENSIDFPAGILQDVFFDKDRPQYMNYGAIGFIIGHEITHGFDNQGRQSDKNGGLVDWWQPKTESAFIEKAQCIIQQYSNISVPEVNLNLNGIRTQAENIADNGGVKQAYLAYKKWSSKHGPEPKLPGLPYSPEQMFWISAGNTWCKVERPEHLSLIVLTDDHSPSYYRVNVPLMNSEYFAKDFNCPLGSKMNPKQHKCKIW